MRPPRQKRKLAAVTNKLAQRLHRRIGAIFVVNVNLKACTSLLADLERQANDNRSTRLT
jgi:hypothetical protein